VHCGGEPQGMLLLIEAINEGGVGTIKEMRHMQWKHSVAQHMAACIQGDDGHFELVL